MRMPWRDQAGLARAVAILATIFGIALGLCGMNFVAMVSLPSSANMPLIVAAYVEVGVLVLSGAGLLLVGLIAMFQAVVAFFRK